MEKPIFDGPLLKMSSSRFQLNAPFSQNTGVYTRIFENAAIFIRVVVVLRPRAIARALTACTCADVIQPCRESEHFHVLVSRLPSLNNSMVTKQNVLDRSPALIFVQILSYSFNCGLYQ